MQLLLLGFVIIGVACNNTVEVNAPFEAQTIVWGVLDYGDTDHYIRIQKSFLPEDINALTIAQISEEIYYNDVEIDVTIDKYIGNEYIQTYPLTRIEGDTINIYKSPGIFSASPNVLYHFNASLDILAEYRLVIYRQNTFDSVCATTTLVSPYLPLFPTSAIPGFDFTDTAEINFVCRYAKNALIYDLTIDILYFETDKETDVTIVKSINLPVFNNQIGTNIAGIGNISHGFNPLTFFITIKNVLEPNPQVYREFSHMDFTFYAGGKVLYDYYLYTLATIGLQEQYNTIKFSNIINGIGLFSSVNKQVVSELILSDASIDSLACGQITSGYGFYSSTSNDFYPFCY